MGCGFLLFCLLFFLPGLYLLKDYIPEKMPIQEKVVERKEQVESDIREWLNLKPKEETDSQKEELLDAGESENGCSYYYWQLNEELRVEYTKILHGIQAREAEINIYCDEDSLKQVMDFLFNDHPELFWSEPSYGYMMYKDWMVLKPVYTCEPAEQKVREALIEQEVAAGLASIPENSSTYECMMALYAYVVNTVEYNLDAPENQNIYSAMVKHSSVCTGYAKELQYLLQRAGIQAFLVSGEVYERGAHAWLIANCDGHYVHLDPTFGDPSFAEEGGDTGSMPKQLQVDYSYLCCDDASILKNRIVADKLPIPVCDSRDYLYYPMQGLYFDEYGDQVLISLQESIDQGEYYWEGQFANEEAYEEMLDQMQEGVFSDLILANYPDWQNVLLHLCYKYDSLVIKMWYEP